MLLIRYEKNVAVSADFLLQSNRIVTFSDLSVLLYIYAKDAKLNLNDSESDWKSDKIPLAVLYPFTIFFVATFVFANFGATCKKRIQTYSN